MVKTRKKILKKKTHPYEKVFPPGPPLPMPGMPPVPPVLSPQYHVPPMGFSSHGSASYGTNNSGYSSQQNVYSGSGATTSQSGTMMSTSVSSSKLTNSLAHSVKDSSILESQHNSSQHSYEVTSTTSSSSVLNASSLAPTSSTNHSAQNSSNMNSVLGLVSMSSSTTTTSVLKNSLSAKFEEEIVRFTQNADESESSLDSIIITHELIDLEDDKQNDAKATYKNVYNFAELSSISEFKRKQKELLPYFSSSSEDISYYVSKKVEPMAPEKGDPKYVERAKKCLPHKNESDRLKIDSSDIFEENNPGDKLAKNASKKKKNATNQKNKSCKALVEKNMKKKKVEDVGAKTKPAINNNDVPSQNLFCFSSHGSASYGTNNSGYSSQQNVYSGSGATTSQSGTMMSTSVSSSKLTNSLAHSVKDSSILESQHNSSQHSYEVTSTTSSSSVLNASSLAPTSSTNHSAQNSSNMNSVLGLVSMSSSTTTTSVLKNSLSASFSSHGSASYGTNNSGYSSQQNVYSGSGATTSQSGTMMSTSVSSSKLTNSLAHSVKDSSILESQHNSSQHSYEVTSTTSSSSVLNASSLAPTSSTNHSAQNSSNMNSVLGLVSTSSSTTTTSVLKNSLSATGKAVPNIPQNMPMLSHQYIMGQAGLPFYGLQQPAVYSYEDMQMLQSNFSTLGLQSPVYSYEDMQMLQSKLSTLGYYDMQFQAPTSMTGRDPGMGSVAYTGSPGPSENSFNLQTPDENINLQALAECIQLAFDEEEDFFFENGMPGPRGTEDIIYFLSNTDIQDLADYTKMLSDSL